MRRFVRPLTPSLSRRIVVGPSASLPTTSATPEFGRRKRRMQRRTEKRMFDVETDDDAKNACFERYGFVQKPMFMETWQEFLRELQRVEISWCLAPSAGGTLQLSIFDHSEPGDGLLCELSGNTSRSAPLAEFFEACGSICQGAATKGEIQFIDGDKHSVLQIVSKNRFVSRDFKEDPPILPFACQHNCRGTSVSLSVLDKRTSVTAPLFSDISVQTLNYAFLTALPIFLKRSDIGVRNVDFVTKDQMRHFRFAWCFLRKESWMTPVEMTELDCLLPP
ncbi:putative mitochondrial hypothetical protein [Leptomonas pyrrhocoris]|uniref:Uncharacterized protein n=1 Tax=Leptomonas pyrrhocoris TaxID=157538 RepID=A0A0N0DXJ9_LEPPY|nr:putative mitochondrial hypothetical protein [Leptomonas pyrrhocoris]KPA83065.1 putative mitochondrial hypothetical protein [Leptomonas pyrrhocoris]|eukprot:XP_015661504.1 putative mitochondrial hypothetical protein [Leptomonas pyrrhocoris]